MPASCARRSRRCCRWITLARHLRGSRADTLAAKSRWKSESSGGASRARVKEDSPLRVNDRSLATDLAETPCDDHRCDSCGVCRCGACCRRDRADWQLPEMGSWPGAVFGELGVLSRDAHGAQCHICGRVFRMLATHVWRTHEVWADEYRVYFGLSAKRGLVGADTSAKLRAAATEYLVPHHEAAVELARAATRGRPLRARGPRIR